MNGAQSDGPAFLINIHRVDNAADAEAYVARLTAMARYLDQAIAEAKDRQARGILPPKWVFPYVIADSKNVISGAPFGPGKDSALFADFKAKVGKLTIAPAEKARLIEAGRRALLDDVRPAYRRVIALMEAQQRAAGTDDGIWRFPNGAAQYADAGPLLHHHRHDPRPDPRARPGAGRAHPRRDERDHGQGRLQGHAASNSSPTCATSRDVYYPNDAAGRQRYLDETQKAKAAIEAELPQYFGTLPKAALVVKPVEPFREKSAGKAFYSDPTPDGSRPGTYYVNLYDMNDMPSTEVEALFCHEGLPGHHLQNALQAELGSAVPPFRQFGGYTAYRRRLGALFGETLQGDGAVHRPLPRLRPPAARASPRDPAGGRHRPPPQALDPRASDQICRGQ